MSGQPAEYLRMSFSLWVGISPSTLSVEGGWLSYGHNFLQLYGVPYNNILIRKIESHSMTACTFKMSLDQIRLI